MILGIISAQHNVADAGNCQTHCRVVWLWRWGFLHHRLGDGFAWRGCAASQQQHADNGKDSVSFSH